MPQNFSKAAVARGRSLVVSMRTWHPDAPGANHAPEKSNIALKNTQNTLRSTVDSMIFPTKTVNENMREPPSLRCSPSKKGEAVQPCRPRGSGRRGAGVDGPLRAYGSPLVPLVPLVPLLPEGLLLPCLTDGLSTTPQILHAFGGDTSRKLLNFRMRL